MHTVLPNPGTGSSNYKVWLFTQLRCMLLVNSEAQCELSASATLNIIRLVTEHTKSLCLVQDGIPVPFIDNWCLTLYNAKSDMLLHSLSTTSLSATGRPPVYCFQIKSCWSVHI